MTEICLLSLTHGLITLIAECAAKPKVNAAFVLHLLHAVTHVTSRYSKMSKNLPKGTYPRTLRSRFRT